jgi:hypothetical protein
MQLKEINSMLRHQLLILVFLLTWASFATGVEPHTEHTFQLSKGESPPSAGLEAVSWLAGSWQGSAFGKTFEEVWNPPSAGSMVGLFKLIDGDTVDFYELMILSVSEQGRLSLKVKHFNADFTAWEDKADFVDFKLVAIEENAVHFAGISFYQRHENHIDSYIVLRTGDKVREEHLDYRRSTEPVDETAFPAHSNRTE